MLCALAAFLAIYNFIYQGVSMAEIYYYWHQSISGLLGYLVDFCC